MDLTIEWDIHTFAIYFNMMAVDGLLTQTGQHKQCIPDACNKRPATTAKMKAACGS